MVEIRAAVFVLAFLKMISLSY